MSLELEANGLRSDPGHLFQRVVEEVAYAIWPPLHEDIQPSYGAIVTDNWLHHFPNIAEVYSGASMPCGDATQGRRLADGVTSFFVTDKSGHFLWIPRVISFSDEASLFTLRDDVLFKRPNRSPQAPPVDTDFVLVQRSSDGVVMIMHWDGVIAMRDGAWSSRRYQYVLNAEESIASKESGMTTATQETVRSLLSICLHVLSPRRHGATIVAVLDNDRSLAGCLGSNESFRPPIELTVRQMSHHGAIAHILGQVDGAALIDESGRLLSLGHWLTPPEHLLRDTRSRGGSRQLTAEATSKAIRSPILTVSSDGPVRVFHRGEMIAST